MVSWYYNSGVVKKLDYDKANLRTPFFRMILNAHALDLARKIKRGELLTNYTIAS